MAQVLAFLERKERKNIEHEVIFFNHFALITKKKNLDKELKNLSRANAIEKRNRLLSLIWLTNAIKRICIRQ